MYLPKWRGNEVFAIPSVEFELSQVVDILKVEVADQLIKKPRAQI